MRYILDEDGYVLYCFFGCGSSGCIEYTGEIPSGYESIDEWADTATINAYKIVDGNLVLDAVRLAELESEEIRIEEENRAVTAKELYNVLSIQNEVNAEEFTNTATGENLLFLVNAGEYAIPKFKFTRAEPPNTWGYLSNFTWGELNNYTWDELKKVSIASWNDDIETWDDDATEWGTLEAEIPEQCFPSTVEVVTTNKNILPSLVENQTINGLEIKANGDGSITINGTATEDTEITLSGSASATEMLFLLKAGVNYFVSGFGELTLKLYDYDGTDRNLIYANGNGALTVNELTRVTHATISISSGTNVSNVTIYPQIEVGTTETEFVVNKRDYLKITLPNDKGDVIEFNNGRVKLNGKTAMYTEYGIKTFETDTWLMVSSPCKTQVTYYMPSVIEQLKTMKITADRIKLEGYTTINNGFAVDEQGNMTCKDAVFTGGNIELQGDATSEDLMTIYNADKTQKSFVNSSMFYSKTNSNNYLCAMFAKYENSAVNLKNTNSYISISALNNGTASMSIQGVNATTEVAYNGIVTPSLTQTSTEKGKKNFKKVKKNTFTDIIKQGDIYEYNLKFEKDTDKKRLGFVIGDGYNVPSEVITKDENGEDIGINLYSMCSVLWQAVKELTAEVDELKKGDNK